jgi:branched-chain amino acid aminotransferase
VDLDSLRAEVQALLEEAAPDDAVLRMVCTRGGRRLAMIEEPRVFPDTIALATVTYAPTRVLDGIKTLSYGANMLCTRLAHERGADEALLVTPHGRVLEAPTSSLFYVIGGQLRTPPLSDHILDSITRRRLLAALEVSEQPVSLDELLGCDEAFLASTTREAQAIASVDGSELSAAPGPRTRECAEVFAGLVAAELGGVAG